MKDLKELGRLKDLGLLTNEEFETARREIFSQRSTVNDPVEDISSDQPKSGPIIENAEVDSSLEPDISVDDTEVTLEQNANWWQASDGQWYPPEALSSVKEQGWFQDDDGQWYPPSQAVTEEESSVSAEHATESSRKHGSEPEPSSAQAPVEQLHREENDQEQDSPGVRPLPIALHSPKSPDSETVNFSQPKNSGRSPGRKKLLIATTAAVIAIVGIMTVIAQSNTTLPTAMEPVRSAVMSSTFGPWEDAQSAFIVSSRGAKKWQALTGAYRAYFESKTFGAKREVGVSRRDDWYVIEYCSEGACEENVFELHLHMGVSDRINDLRWFRGTKDSLSEVPIYEVRLDPEYVFDDPLQAWSDDPWSALRIGMDFDYAIQDFESGCLIGKAITPLGIIKGEMTVDGYATSSLKSWTLYLGLDARIRTADGLELESNYGGYPRDLDVDESGEDEFTFCVDYNISEAIEFVVPGGEWWLYTDEGTKTYSKDFVVPFQLVEL